MTKANPHIGAHATVAQPCIMIQVPQQGRTAAEPGFAHDTLITDNYGTMALQRRGSGAR